MKYQSKKDTSIIASIEKTEEKYGTVLMKYLTGPDTGRTFSITNSTLKRWWKRVEDEEENTANNPLSIDINKVNEPYHPDVTPRYIPKPKSVIEYEAKKGKKYNNELPEFEEISESLAEYCKKINDNSKYVMFHDKSTMWRKCGAIDLYASESLWSLLTESGLQSKPNKDKDRPFAFKITNIEEYNKVLEAVKGV